jgi:LacI family transcriptional regulator
MRSLAKTLGLSRATISNALRGVGRVSPETVRLVRQAAKDAGYRHNPLAGALMSELRQARGNTFRGVLAAVDIEEPGRPPHGPFHRELVLGMRERAADLGYQLEEFIVRAGGYSPQRLDAILQARGIHGIALLPSWFAPDWQALDWSRYVGIYTDYIIKRPALDCVTTDPYRSIMETLTLLASRGYRRPGLVMERNRDKRTHYRFSAPFRTFPESENLWEFVPPLLFEERNREEFVAWFKRHQPDVVLTHFTDTIGWMEECGARVPDTHGFVGLNALFAERRCAALDLQPRLIGSRTVELLTAQLQRHELGIPEWPTLTTISARWVEGPTVRRGEGQRVSQPAC